MEEEFDHLLVQTSELRVSLEVMHGMNHGLEIRVDALEQQVTQSKCCVEYYSSKVKQLQVRHMFTRIFGGLFDTC